MALAERAWLIVGSDHTILPLRARVLGDARRFYVFALGMIEVADPAASPGSLTLHAGATKLVLDPSAPAYDQPVTLSVCDLHLAAEKLEAHGYPTRSIQDSTVGRIVETRDPAGNRLLLIGARG